MNIATLVNLRDDNLSPTLSSLQRRTTSILKFWLNIAQQEGELSRKEFTNLLNSWGWNRRTANPWLKLAKFLQSHFPNNFLHLGRLEIRTLLKLPTKAYASVVEALKQQQLTQVEVEEIIKSQRKSTSKVGRMIKELQNYDRLSQKSGLTVQTLAEAGASVLDLLWDGDIESAIARVKELKIQPEPEPEITPISEQLALLKQWGLSLEEAVYFQPSPHEFPVAGVVKGVAQGQVEVDCGNTTYLLDYQLLQKFDPQGIYNALTNPNMSVHPYSLIKHHATAYKASALTQEEHQVSYIQTTTQRLKASGLKNALNIATINGIWFDVEELKTNYRLVFIPGGDDWLLTEGFPSPSPLPDDGKSLLEVLAPPPPFNLCTALRECVKWEEITRLCDHNIKNLSIAIKDNWSEAEKQNLIDMLSDYLVREPQAILQGELDWLPIQSLEKALHKLQFQVLGKTCSFQKVDKYKTEDETWFFDDGGEYWLNCSRVEFSIVGCK